MESDYKARYDISYAEKVEIVGKKYKAMIT